MNVINLSEKPYNLLNSLKLVPPTPTITRALYLTEPQGSLDFRLAALSSALEYVAEHNLTPDDVIVMDRSTEVGWISPDRAEVIVSFCRDRDFPIGRFVYASQDRLTMTNLASTFAKFESASPSWIWFHHYLAELLKWHVGYYKEHFDITRICSEPPRFLCLSNKVRPHRLAIAARILDTPALVSVAQVSFRADRTMVFGMADAEREIAKTLPSFSAAVERQKYAVSALGSIHTEGGRVTSPVLSLPTEAVRRSLFVLVPESEYRSSKRITEKTLKSIVYMRPFLIAGPPGALAEVRNLGFQTFSPIIDERYDDEPDHDRRLTMVMDEVEALVTRLEDSIYRRYFTETMSVVCRANRAHFDNRLADLIQHRLENDINNLFNVGGAGVGRYR